ncbi:MAG: MocE family 2Fe-2S type ferredoxin [Acetobacteraceae bacterium]
MSGWVAACATNDIATESVIRFDNAGRTFAIYRDPDDAYDCTDGLCTHGKVHLAGGAVMDFEIECPKHHGVFDYRTGEAVRPPPCIDLKTYAVQVKHGRVLIDL